MTYAEKKSALMSNKTARNIWYVLLIVIVANFAYGLFSLVQYFAKNTSTISAAGLVPGGLTISAIVLAVALQIFYFYGVWKLERWVTMLMWLGFVSSILSFDFLNIVISAIVLFGFKKVLKVVYPKKLATQTKPAN